MVNQFADRRRRLAQRLPEKGAAVLFSGEEIPQGVDMTYPFSVDKSFFYLTGISSPGAALLVSQQKQLLFLPPFSEKREMYEGPQETHAQLCKRAGFPEADARPAVQPEEMTALLAPGDCLYTDVQRASVACFRPPCARLADCARAAGITVKNVYPEVFSLRAVKDAQEIANIRRAVDITGSSLTYMAQNCRAGMREYEWQAAFEYGLTRNGCSTSFDSITASGANATYLHYTRNDAVVNAGELFLFDVGAYYNGYASDISRTYPVGGRFTERQRSLYELVYEVTRLVLEHMLPYHPYGEHAQVMQQYFSKYLKPLHIAETEIEREKFMYMLSRGCCHHLGLDAHDGYAANDDILLPGMVFTNEPGVYLRNEGIGIRIEEDLCITETGNELLSSAIPAAPEEVAALLH